MFEINYFLNLCIFNAEFYSHLLQHGFPISFYLRTRNNLDPENWPFSGTCFLHQISSLISLALFHLSACSLIGPSSCCQSQQLSYLCPTSLFPKCPVPFWQSIYSSQERLVTPGSRKWSSHCPACSLCWLSPPLVRTCSLYSLRIADIIASLECVLKMLELAILSVTS